jgi:hypothetical protein
MEKIHRWVEFLYPLAPKGKAISKAIYLKRNDFCKACFDSLVFLAFEEPPQLV